MTAFPNRTTLGRSGLRVSKLGLGSSFKAPVASYLDAFERGVNYFYWGSLRRSLMGDAIREIARQKRDEISVVLQSYSRWGWQLERSVEGAIRKLGIDHGDVLLLGWHNSAPPRSVVDAALELKHRERIRTVAISSHRRTFFPTLLDDDTYSIWHVRYNAVHRGAEKDVFPTLETKAEGERPGVVTYTTTSWGQLCDPAKTPSGEPTPTGTDCYRFAISNPDVDLCLAGPDNADQMNQALAALELGPMDEEEQAWMRRVGDYIYGKDATASLRDGAT
jgi:aryl-alcohol dehydrogenase-like predicted oxidoreductase